MTSAISNVTVYRDHARITRSGKVTVGAGDVALIVPSLPANMLTDSVRVRGYGEGITIRGVDTKLDVPDTNTDPQQVELKREKARLQSQLNVQEQQLSVIEAHRQYLDNLAKHSGEAFSKALVETDDAFDRVTQVASFIRSELSSVYEQTTDTQEKIAQLENEIEQLSIRLDNSSEDTKHGYALHINLHSKNAEIDCTISIDYVVTGASWYPVYDVRLDAENNIQLSYNAQVSQSTGERWETVELTLSTAQVAVSQQLPE